MSGRLRAPRPTEHDELAALCRRSKAVWGYSASFLDACADALRVDPSLVEQDLVRVVELEGQLVGVVQVDPDASSYGAPFEHNAELELLFVDPTAMRRGVGQTLFAFARTAAVRSGKAGLAILSDPGARAFYEHLGAEFVRDAPSDAIAGRTLPLLRVRV